MLKISYFGSPQFSAQFLESVLTDLDLKKVVQVELVVTQPDRLAGKKQILTPTPVKIIAQKNKIKVIDNLSCLKKERNFKNLDLALLYAYGEIIPASLLTLPKLGFWNVHPSLLPKYRGPSPIAYPLIMDEKETGVTIIKMDEKIDHGPIIAQEKITINDEDLRPDLEKKLAHLAFDLFKKLILKDNLKQLKLTPQKHNLASYTRLLKKDDGFIIFSFLKKILNQQPINEKEIPPLIRQNKKRDPFIKKILDLYRGLYPWPGIWTILPNGKRLKITKLSVNNEKLLIDKVQLEGKKEVDFTTFNRAYKMF